MNSALYMQCNESMVKYTINKFVMRHNEITMRAIESTTTEEKDTSSKKRKRLSMKCIENIEGNGILASKKQFLPHPHFLIKEL